MTSTKKMLTLALSAMLVFVLAACGAGNNGNNGTNGGNATTPPATTNNDAGNDAAAPAEKVDLTFWSLGANGYEAHVAEWNAANPNIQVTIQNTGDQTEHHNNLLTALSADSGAPDIFMLEIAFVDKFMTSPEKFYNLNDLGAADIKGNYLDWKWQQVSSADGSFQLGLPTDIGPTAAYFRTDLAEAAGLPADPDAFSEAISTWDKLVEVAKAYTASTGKPFVDSTDLLYNALRDQSEGEIYFSQADGSLIIEQNAQIKKAYDLTVQGIQEGWIGSYGLWSPEWYNAMNTDGFVVSFSPAWMMNTFKGNAPDTAGKWKIAQLPDGAGNWGGAFLTIPKESEHPEQSYQFISWLLNQENQLKSFQANGLFPSIPALYTDAGLTEYTDEYFSGQQTGVAFGKAAERVAPVYYGGLHDTADGLVKQGLRNVLEIKADPQAEWDIALEEIKKLTSR